MLDSNLQEYQKFKAAQSFCAVYGNTELLPEEINESNSAWNKLSFQQINNAPQRTPFFITSASTQLDLLDAEEDQVKELIARIKWLSSIVCKQKLVTIADRILALLKDAKEEDEFSIGISPDSLRSFYSFISTHSDLKRPKLSLTPENNLYASWKSGSDKVFSVHFLSDGDARFIIFKPNKRHPDRPIRLSGVAPVDDLLQEVVNPDEVAWAFE